MLGLIGGIGPESTIEYYRLLVEGYRPQRNGEYPPVIINSVELQRLIAWLNSGQLNSITNYLVDEIQRLARAGATFAALCSNTPHIVFEEIQSRTDLPLVSIVESALLKVGQLGVNKVALIGTRFTMNGGFYQKVFSRAALELIVPDTAEQNFIHEKYMGELLGNQFLPSTRDQVLAIVDRLRVEHQVQAVILGGTELPLLLRTEQHNEVQLLDTTRIHVERLLERLLLSAVISIK